jgi:hemolysin activation/secretion protein
MLEGKTRTKKPNNERKHMPLAKDTLTPPSNRRPLKTNKKQAASTALAVALVLAGHQTVHAQTLSESAARAIEAQRRANEREEQLRKQLERTPHVHLQKEQEDPRAPLDLNETPCFFIQTLELKGLEALYGLNMHRRLLQSLSQPDSPIGQCLGVQGIQILVGRLQNALVAHGYITSQVNVGPQNINTGHLQLEIVPGRLGKKRLQQENPKISLRNVLPLNPGDTVNLRHVEQALENLKRIPSAEADIQIEPGQEPGLSDLVIDWKQSSPYRWGLTLDDSGTRSTGKIQGSATLHIDNPLGLSDLLYLTLNQSLAAADPGPRGTRGYTAHYSLPWKWWAFSATLSDNRYHQSIAGAFQNYTYSGTTQNIELKASRIVQRDSLGKTSLGIKAFQRASRNFIEDTEVEVIRGSLC